MLVMRFWSIKRAQGSLDYSWEVIPDLFMVVLYMTPPDTPRIDAEGHWGTRAGGVMVLLVTLLVLIHSLDKK